MLLLFGVSFCWCLGERSAKGEVAGSQSQGEVNVLLLKWLMKALPSDRRGWKQWQLPSLRR